MQLALCTLAALPACHAVSNARNVHAAVKAQLACSAYSLKERRCGTDLRSPPQP